MVARPPTGRPDHRRRPGPGSAEQRHLGDPDGPAAGRRGHWPLAAARPRPVDRARLAPLDPPQPLEARPRHHPRPHPVLDRRGRPAASGVRPEPLPARRVGADGRRLRPPGPRGPARRTARRSPAHPARRRPLPVPLPPGAGRRIRRRRGRVPADVVPRCHRVGAARPGPGGRAAPGPAAVHSVAPAAERGGRPADRPAAREHPAGLEPRRARARRVRPGRREAPRALGRHRLLGLAPASATCACGTTCAPATAPPRIRRPGRIPPSRRSSR